MRGPHWVYDGHVHTDRGPGWDLDLRLHLIDPALLPTAPFLASKFRVSIAHLGGVVSLMLGTVGVWTPLLEAASFPSFATSSQSFTEHIGAVEYYPCCHQNTTNACGVDVECFCAVLTVGVLYWALWDAHHTRKPIEAPRRLGPI